MITILGALSGQVQYEIRLGFLSYGSGDHLIARNVENTLTVAAKGSLAPAQLASRLHDQELPLMMGVQMAPEGNLHC